VVARKTAFPATGNLAAQLEEQFFRLAADELALYFDGQAGKQEPKSESAISPHCVVLPPLHVKKVSSRAILVQFNLPNFGLPQNGLDMRNRLIETSKFLSYVLRHQPEAIGITLNSEGWIEISKLIVAAANYGKQLDRDLIQTVVATNDKKRFAISEDGLHIRAVQGHSTDSVNIRYAEKVPPEFLYHGTATRFLNAIRKEGLRPGSRQHVHLSQDEHTAISVGQRHGKPVVLKIQALLMYEKGFKFFQAENGVWLTNVVPTAHIVECS
jgi:putative RNA 2'-phosphotransferase